MHVGLKVLLCCFRQTEIKVRKWLLNGRLDNDIHLVFVALDLERNTHGLKSELKLSQHISISYKIQ